MVITACLARGSLSMSKKQTIIKDINAMQGFGSMDVLCMDKTGTLTNESILLEYYMDVLGNESGKVLDLAFLNSAYHSGVCNPIDNAILACQTMPGHEQHFADLLMRYQKEDEIPFDYSRKFVSTLVTDKNGDCQLIMKGNISQIVSRCSHVEFRGEILPMEKNGMQSVASVVDEMLQDGMKVIAVARKKIEKQDQIIPTDEKNMILMGYLAFFDAPKKTAKTSVEALKRLQVTPKILTGDQVEVAASICRRVKIPSEIILTGVDLDQMTDDELGKTVEDIHVFAELTPGQKVRIVSALRQNGHTVGFLGDGINDIPALCESNVGISVDTAVDAAKDAADVVLLQKDLGVLEQGILEGRKTFTNMLKYIKITASSNFGNIFSIVCASAFLPFLPMTSLQILLLNLLYDILCIILPWDNVDEEETLSPRDWSGKTLGRFMLFFGPISSIFDIVTFLFLYYILCPLLCGGTTYLNMVDPVMQSQYVALFQTGWFLESMWTQVLILHFLRTRKIPFVQSSPSIPVVCTTFAGIIVFTSLTFTKSAGVIGLTKLPIMYFLFLFVVSIDVFGKCPEKLAGIITTATAKLALLISKVLTVARELKNKLFYEALEKEYGSKAVIKAEDTTDVIIAPAKEAITEPEPPVNTITTTVPKAEVVEQPKPQIPPRPVMPPEVAAFPRLQKIKFSLDKHNHLIFEAERERTKLELELSDLKGLARLTKKKELESRISTKNEEIRTLKAGLSGIVRQHGFATVQDFYAAFYTAQRVTDAYQKECAKWEEIYGDKVSLKAETMHDKIKRYQEKADRLNASQPYRIRDKGAR